MNPRDEKILIVLRNKQNAKYSNLVPFEVVSSCMSWVDKAELLSDLSKLSENGYLITVDNPITHAGFWYALTAAGQRECDRIRYEDKEARKNRNIQLISSVVSAVLGFLLGKFS